MPHAQHIDNSWRYTEDGLVIWLSLAVPDPETHHVPVMNMPDVPCTLYPGARIKDVFPIMSLKQAQEVLQADPWLSDWN